jgi:hypothetical protein
MRNIQGLLLPTRLRIGLGRSMATILACPRLRAPMSAFSVCPQAVQTNSDCDRWLAAFTVPHALSGLYRRTSDDAANTLTTTVDAGRRSAVPMRR